MATTVTPDRYYKTGCKESTAHGSKSNSKSRKSDPRQTVNTRGITFTEQLSSEGEGSLIYSTTKKREEEASSAVSDHKNLQKQISNSKPLATREQGSKIRVSSTKN